MITNMHKLLIDYLWENEFLKKKLFIDKLKVKFYLKDKFWFLIKIKFDFW